MKTKTPSLAVFGLALLVNVVQANSKDVSVDARIPRWQKSKIILTKGQKAVITVPEIKVKDEQGNEKTDFQKWGVIDWKNRGKNAAWGFGVGGGNTFAGPGLFEGA